MIISPALSPQAIKNSASFISLELLQSKGLTKSDFLYSSIQKVLIEALTKGLYSLPISWPDGVFSVFTSDEPLSLEDLQPGQLKGAYHKSRTEGNYHYHLEEL